jgi:hypothetical protein
MQNGAAIALPPELDPPVGSTKAIVPGKVEQQIAVAIANAVTAIGAGLLDWEAAGSLRDTTRRLAGEHLGRVAMLQLEHPGSDADFTAIARSAGRRELWRRNGTGFRAHYGAAFDEAGIDRAIGENIGWVLSITTKVVRDERARAH